MLLPTDPTDNAEWKEARTFLEEHLPREVFKALRLDTKRFSLQTAKALVDQLEKKGIITLSLESAV